MFTKKTTNKTINLNQFNNFLKTLMNLYFHKSCLLNILLTKSISIKSSLVAKIQKIIRLYDVIIKCKYDKENKN